MTATLVTAGEAPDGNDPPPAKNRRNRLFTGVSLVTLVVMTAGFVQTSTSWNLSIFNDFGFGQNGFDLGIFSQGTWLLSQGHDPFVTIRGLNLFGDHASFILLLVAPVFRVLPDPRVLIVAQVLFIAAPAIAIWLYGRHRIGPVPATLVAVAYLALPGVAGGVDWSFHPEAFAASFLAFAVLAFDKGRMRTMAVLLVLALLCKEDISLVVLAFGAIVWIEGHKRAGIAVMVGAVAYFAIAMSLIGIFNSAGSVYLERNYGIDGSGLLDVLIATPQIIGGMFAHLFTMESAKYLALVIGPLLVTTLRSWWLLALAGPLFMNLASNNVFQRDVDYQYLITSSPFLAFAAVDGLRRLVKHRNVVRALATLAFAITVAVAMTNAGISYVPDQATEPASVRRAAIALVPDDASVTATYNFQAQLSTREEIFDFPHPFTTRYWVLHDKTPPQPVVDGVDYVVIDEFVMADDMKTWADYLKADTAKWKTIYDTQGVVVLQRVR